MSRILLLTSRPPFPVSGDRVRVRQQIAWLSRCHEVSVLTFVRSPAEQKQLEQLRREGLRVTGIPVRMGESVPGLVRAGLRGRPLQTGYFDAPPMAEELRRRADAECVDVVYFHLVRMAQYWRPDAPYAQLLDMCDALSVQYAERARLRAAHDVLGRSIDDLESRRLVAWEHSVLQKFDAVSIISSADAAAVQPDGPPFVIPLHVQDYLDYRPSLSAAPGGMEVLFPGEMSTEYSRSAARFLAREVMPLVWARQPNATLSIVGANPARDVLALQGPQVTVTGYVEDLRPYVARAAVVACPIRIGTGLKTKVLQAMALGTPVVASTLANRGIGAAHGEHLLLADEAPACAAAVLRLGTDAPLRAAITARARRFIKERFSERCMGECLDTFIAQGLGKAAQRRQVAAHAFEEH